MPRAERRRVPVAGAFGVAVAVLAAILPSLRVVSAGIWLAQAALLVVLILVTGLVARRLRIPGLLVIVPQAIVWVLTVTGMFLSPAAWFGVIPSPRVVTAVQALVAQAISEMNVGVPPLAATPPVSFFFVAAAGALAIVLDYVALTTRLPLLGAVALLAVALAPSIAVPGRVDVWQYALLAVAILFLLWTDTRTRTRVRTRVRDAAPVTAAVLAVAAVMVSVVLTPLLPPPSPRVVVGSGGTTGIDPTLQFGEDLRRPNAVEVLRVRTSGTAAPYLRATTSSTFDGDDWLPDTANLAPYRNGAGIGAVSPAPEIASTDVETHVEIDDLHTPYLPLPYPAVTIDGLDGRWGVQRENRTVQAVDADAAGQTYDVESTVPRPTLQQIRAAATAGTGDDLRYLGLPTDTPQIVFDLAAEVTAEETTPFDKAEAIQAWFRSDEFRYSLDAPVDGDYDGSGVQAIGEFLQVREGYCIHFASAFALMTRSLGMPTRVVVGYLPGKPTGETIDDRMVYAVDSDQLHAWPEVYFEGIGWIGFEPTNSLGAPPSFSSAGTGSTTPTDPSQTEESAAPSASPAPTRDAQDIPQDTASGGGTVGTTSAGWAVTGLVTAGLLVLLILPALFAAVRRRARLARGDVLSAWLYVQETAIDLGIPVPASATPRGFGEELRRSGAEPETTERLVDALERTSYAPPGEAQSERDPAVAAAARELRMQLLRAAGRGRRWRAILVPRSLVVRPLTPQAAVPVGR